MFEAAILIVTPELAQSEFDALLPLVSPKKQERLKSFKFFRDARNCLLGDLLARVEINRVAGLDAWKLEFTTNAYGKPLLVGRPRIHFNISHAGDYIACAVANEPVGIDVEVIKDTDLKIAERFFAVDEMTYVTDGDSTRRFYEIWTKKESHIKWEGKGLHKSLPSFSVFESSVQELPCIYHEIFVDDEAICHVCSTKSTPPSVRTIAAFELMQSINMRC